MYKVIKTYNNEKAEVKGTFESKRDAMDYAKHIVTELITSYVSMGLTIPKNEIFSITQETMIGDECHGTITFENVNYTKFNFSFDIIKED